MGSDINVMLANFILCYGVLKPLTQHREFTMGMIIREVCPRCKSPTYKKNGHIHNGKQNHLGYDCGRQFVDCFEQYLIPDNTRTLIERLPLERLSLRGICRAVGVGLKWLLGFIVTCFEALPDHLNVQPISCNQDIMIQRLEVEVDDMASFVQKKTNKQWIWLAMDANTRQIIAFHVGDRSRKNFKKLWAMIPKVYRHHATFYTDQYVVYKRVIPAAQHYPMASWPAKLTTLSGLTIRYDSGCHAWFAVRCRFPRSSPITSALSSISFAPTTC